jgi:hypothetical protein
MATILDPFQFVLTTLAGWMNQRQLHVIDYGGRENRVLREQLGERLRLNDDQRCRLAAKAKRLGRTILEEIATIAGGRNHCDRQKHGAKLVVDWAANTSEHPHRIDFHDTGSAAFWIFWALMAVFIGMGFLPQRRRASACASRKLRTG